MRTRVKFCGFTQPGDAREAALLGADAIGLVFYPPSPRNVDCAQAREIVRALPPFTTVVALFVDAEEDKIKKILQQVPIDVLQFHGNEPAIDCRKYAIPYIKAVRMQSRTDIANILSEYHDAAGLLLDAYHPDAKGGTGMQFNWQWVPQQCSLPIILAGGLSPENAYAAIQSVHPYALDVSSGVEQDKGIKNADLMRAFLTEVVKGDRK